MISTANKVENGITGIRVVFVQQGGKGLTIGCRCFVSLLIFPLVYMYACMVGFKKVYLSPTTKTAKFFRKIQISGTDGHFLLVFAMKLLLLGVQLATNCVSLEISVSTLMAFTYSLNSFFILSDFAYFSFLFVSNRTLVLLYT